MFRAFMPDDHFPAERADGHQQADDLPAFCTKIVEEFAKGEHDEQAKRTAQAVR